MPPHLALSLSFMLLFYLFYVDYKQELPVSKGLWLPVIWMALMGSRPVSLWFSQGPVYGSIEEGSPMEATVYSVLIFAGLFVLLRRQLKFSFSELVTVNKPLFLLLAYYFIAILWSDHPFVSFKRYVKLAGTLIFVLVILTEIEPKLAFRFVLRRCGYVLLLLSIVLAKYFPSGADYSEWTGAKMIVGVTQAKNLLGQDCLLFGLFFISEIIMQWKDRGARRDRLILSINLFMVFLAIKLLLMSNSITSLVCMGLGAAIMFAAGFDSVRKNIGIYILSATLTFLFLNWSLEIMPTLIESLGRDTTLTDRTDIWDLLLPMAKTSLWFGSGYENFWMGDRPLKIWPLVGRINEAHNGYLEIVLDTGLVGLSFFIIYLVSAYRRCKEDLLSNPEYGRFAMAFFFTMLVYNFTEAAFKSLCILFFVLLTNSFRIPDTNEASVDDRERWQSNDLPFHQISPNNPTAWQQ